MNKVVSCLLFALVMALPGCGTKGVTGNEWLLMQQNYLPEFESMAGSMDEVFSLYLAGLITEEDFSREVYILRAQYIILQGVYTSAKAENPVLPETYSYISQKGVEGVEKALMGLGGILDNSLGADGWPPHPDELALVYLAFRQEISAGLAQYITALVWLQDAQEVGEALG